ncbi:MAG: phage holin [Butyricicoccaceae bacterium]
MNWKIRLKNPVFWVQVLTGALATVLAVYSGLTAADMTTWAGLWGVITGAFSNPYCLFLVASNVWNALNDPTTSGLTDSDRAKSYNVPLEK